MITPETKKKIMEAIKERDDWKDTTPPEEPDEPDFEWYHSNWVFEFLGTPVVYSEFSNRHESIRDFYVWEEGKLRNATEDEDQVFRAADDEESFRDSRAMDLIISRDHDNSIYEGDSEFPAPKED